MITGLAHTFLGATFLLCIAYIQGVILIEKLVIIEMLYLHYN